MTINKIKILVISNLYLTQRYGIYNIFLISINILYIYKNNRLEQKQVYFYIMCQHHLNLKHHVNQLRKLLV